MHNLIGKLALKRPPNSPFFYSCQGACYDLLRSFPAPLSEFAADISNQLWSSWFLESCEDVAGWKARTEKLIANALNSDLQWVSNLRPVLESTGTVGCPDFDDLVDGLSYFLTNFEKIVDPENAFCVMRDIFDEPGRRLSEGMPLGVAVMKDLITDLRKVRDSAFLSPAFVWTSEIIIANPPPLSEVDWKEERFSQRIYNSLKKLL